MVADNIADVHFGYIRDGGWFLVGGGCHLHTQKRQRQR
jgi:hypothetical protein